MQQFTYPLLKENQRPTIRLLHFGGIDAMLDTGALFPVWTSSENLLKELGGVLLREEQSFSGFGGEAHGNLYRIRQFSFGKLTFVDLPVLACYDEKLPCNMLLSATMFHDLIYTINQKHHYFSVEIPDDESVIRNLKVEDSSGRLFIGRADTI